jgi:cation/acetate symporter
MGNFLLASVAAVAFATIVAVVAGLVLASASAMAHDIYVGVIRNGDASPKQQVNAARIATLLVGLMSIFIGILAKGQNVAHLVGLAFAVAASANLPCIVLTLYWKRCNTGGIMAGMLTGIIVTIGLVLVSPTMTYPSVMGLEEPLFTLKNPGIISIPLGFLSVIAGSLLYRDKRAEAMWEELYVRQHTGMMRKEDRVLA